MSEKLITSNRQAGFRFILMDKYEAGLMLTGSEVKSLRDGKANLVDSYVHFKNNELFLISAHIAPYPPANQLNHEPTRPRKLLLHAKEIQHLMGKMKEKGLTLIPTRLYFKNGKAKVTIALAKGKKMHDKRESLKKKVSDREIQRGMKIKGR